jgi:hypothetical protein
MQLEHRQIGIRRHRSMLEIIQVHIETAGADHGGYGPSVPLPNSGRASRAGCAPLSMIRRTVVLARDRGQTRIRLAFRHGFNVLGIAAHATQKTPGYPPDNRPS